MVPFSPKPWGISPPKPSLSAWGAEHPCNARPSLPGLLTPRSNVCSLLKNTVTSIPSQGSPKAPVEEGASRETLNRIEASKGKNWPGSKLFQAKESHLVSKCWAAKQTWIQFMEGRERRGRGRGGEGEEKRGRRGTASPNSQTKMDFLLSPNCISKGFFPPRRITGMNMSNIATKQPDGLPDLKENYPSAMMNCISQRPDNSVPSVAIVQIPSCKRWPGIYKGCSLTGAEHTYTNTHTHTYTHAPETSAASSQLHPGLTLWYLIQISK